MSFPFVHAPASVKRSWFSSVQGPLGSDALATCTRTLPLAVATAYHASLPWIMEGSGKSWLSMGSLATSVLPSQVNIPRFGGFIVALRAKELNGKARAVSARSRLTKPASRKLCFEGRNFMAASD